MGKSNVKDNHYFYFSTCEYHQLLIVKGLVVQKLLWPSMSTLSLLHRPPPLDNRIAGTGERKPTLIAACHVAVCCLRQLEKLLTPLNSLCRTSCTAKTCGAPPPVRNCSKLPHSESEGGGLEGNTVVPAGLYCSIPAVRT